MTTESKSLPVLAGWQDPAVRALDLATIGGDGSTTLVSLSRRCVLGDFEGEQAQQGIPHLHLTDEIEAAASQAAGNAEARAGEGFPGWPAVLDYLRANRDLLSTGHWTAATAGSVGLALERDPRLQGLCDRLGRQAEGDQDVQFAEDDLVYDHVGTGKHASAVNNEGIEGQADALAERIGLEFALEELRGVIDQFKDGGE